MSNFEMTLQKYKIIDDVMPKGMADRIESMILKDSIVPFVFVGNVAKIHGEKNQFGFAHVIFSESGTSPFLETALPILELAADKCSIGIGEVIMIRSFLQTPPPSPSRNTSHTDTREPHWVCLYYVNDSEGDTILFNDDGSELVSVTPKKNRAVLFDGRISHCATEPTNRPRCVINFNFMPSYGKL